MSRAKIVLDLKRRWRDTRVAPDADRLGYITALGDDDDPALRRHFGFYEIGSLAENQCVFLLGRPGAGKSSEVERIEQHAVPAFADEWIIPIRCKEAGLDIFEEFNRDPKVAAGLGQTKPLRLMLDGLDEGFLRDPAFFARLKRTLEILRSNHPTLRLLLTCRPAEWDTGFGESVHELWRGEGKPAVFALEPLSQQNQRALLLHWNVKNPDEFFRWVHRNRFVEFAAWPRSLKWLAEQFKAGGRETLTYTQLCRLRVQRSFGEDKRLADAQRAQRAEDWSHAIILIAATLVFCAKKGIALDTAEADCLTLDEIFTANDRLKLSGAVTLTREDLREAVQNSHLLEEHGGYHRFENQSDLEYLAAAMLASLSVEQLGELLGSFDDEKRWRVFPQLAATAASLAAQSAEFFEYLLTYDPRVLMRVDFASKAADACRAAVDAMLRATAVIGATGEHDQHALFSTLRHAELTSQLRPWLFDQNKPFVVRELAFDIARECCAGEIWIDFERAAAAGDAFAERWLPVVIRRFGSSWREEKLRHWAVSERDELAGAALDALADRGWKFRDLVPLLREPASDAYGLYHMHFDRLQRECTADDVPVALAAIGKWPGARATFGASRDLVLALLAKGFTALERPDVRKAITDFLVARFQEDDWLLENAAPKLGLDNQEIRRNLLLALVDHWPTDTRAELMPFNYPLPAEDYSWLLEAVASATGKRAVALAKFAAHLVWQFDEALREQVERTYAKSSDFRAHLPVADETGIYATLQRLRAEAQARHRSRLEEIRRKHKRNDFSGEELFADALTRCGAGEVQAWTSLCYALSEPKNEHDTTAFYRNVDPRALAGWTKATAEVRAEMTQFARQFLLGVDVPTPAPRTIPGAFFGLAYALTLHASNLDQDRELVAAIRPVWALALLRHCESHLLADPLAKLKAAAPLAVAEACRIEFRERWQRNEPIYDQLLAAAWSNETEKALVEVLSQSPLQPETYTSGIAMLAAYNPASAKQLADNRRAEQIEIPEDSPARRAAIAVCLFFIPDLWQNAWPNLVADRAAARRLLLEYSGWLDYHEREQRIAKLGDDLVASLYALMIELFPSSETPQHSGGYTPTGLDHAYTLRDRLQRSLEARGLHAELSAIYKRFEETRGAWWTPASVERARNIAHAGRRESPTAAQFIRLIATEGGTFVSDNDSLQRAVLVSLRRFEKSLKPDGLVAIWEKNLPRSEDALQSAIVAHLRRDFEERKIVINMETKVIRERSDIRVQAAPYVVTLEVKLGHSNDRDRPLRSAMRSQLRAYLENQNETHGIYVVGWFFGPTFGPGGLRDMKTARSAQRYFDAQARKLSTNRYVIAACVIDCRWPEATASRAPRKKIARSAADNRLVRRSNSVS